MPIGEENSLEAGKNTKEITRMKEVGAEVLLFLARCQIWGDSRSKKSVF